MAAPSKALSRKGDTEPAARTARESLRPVKYYPCLEYVVVESLRWLLTEGCDHHGATPRTLASKHSGRRRRGF